MKGRTGLYNETQGVTIKSSQSLEQTPISDWKRHKWEKIRSSSEVTGGKRLTWEGKHKKTGNMRKNLEKSKQEQKLNNNQSLWEQDNTSIIFLAHDALVTQVILSNN